MPRSIGAPLLAEANDRSSTPQWIGAGLAAFNNARTVPPAAAGNLQLGHTCPRCSLVYGWLMGLRR
jgi:hypothetical protein